MKIDLDPCNEDGAKLSLDVTEQDHNIDFPIVGIKAGESKNIPIPGNLRDYVITLRSYMIVIALIPVLLFYSIVWIIGCDAVVVLRWLLVLYSIVLYSHPDKLTYYIIEYAQNLCILKITVRAELTDFFSLLLLLYCTVL